MVREETAAIQNAVRNVAGSLGGLKSEMLREFGKLKKIEQTQPEGSVAAKAAAKSQAILLKGLRENYPELAEIIESDLSQSNFAAAPAAAQFDEAALDRRVSEKLAEVETRLATDALDMAMPDWRERIAMRDSSGQLVRDTSGRLMTSNEFKSWLSQKPATEQHQFWHTNSPKFVASTIRQYEEAAAKGQQQQRERKQDRLTRAVVPQGRSQPVVQQEIDEEAAMNRAFAAVRSGHL
jgi:hypothetical protein